MRLAYHIAGRAGVTGAPFQPASPPARVPESGAPGSARRVERRVARGYAARALLQLLEIGLVIAAVLALIWAAYRSRELFVLEVERGKTRVQRGRPPHVLLQDLADVFARADVQRATVKVVREGGRPRLMASGLEDTTLQRARNVLGAYPAHKLLGS